MTVSDTPESIADRSRQHSREAIFGFAFNSMRKRHHGAPVPLKSTQDAHDSEPMDHHITGVGTITEDPKNVNRTSVDDAVNCAKNVYATPDRCGY